MNTNEIVLFLDGEEIDYFEIHALAEQMNKPFTTVQNAVELLVKSGLLSRIEKGKYCKHSCT